MNLTSQQKLEANRKNAQKSTGPRTPEGKDRSRRNALKHGLLAKSILINEKDPNEDPADFDQLLNELTDDLKPKGALEQLLTQRLAVSYWRLRRAYRFEAVSICDHRRDATQSLTAQLAQGISGIERDPADYVLPNAKDLEKLLRYETLIDRELNRTMLQLQRLQRARTIPHSSAKERSKAPDAVDVAKRTPSSLRPSVPSSLPPSLPQPNEPKTTPPEAHGLQSVRSKRDQSPDQQRHNPPTKRTQTPNTFFAAKGQKQRSTVRSCPTEISNDSGLCSPHESLENIARVGTPS